MPYAQLVIGPAGSGKSTYCSNIQQHCHSIGRTIHVINLDPAADEFKYSVTSDVRDLINLDEVMEEEELGPNGALMFCICLLYTSPSPRDQRGSRMPSSA